MSKNGKEYKLAIRIAGVVDKSYDLALTSASTKIKGFKGVMGKLDGTFTELDKGFDKVMNAGKKCFDAITTAAKIASIAVGAVTAASIKVGSDFEAEMSVVQAISQATDDELDLLSKKAREVGKTTVFSATEVGKAMEYMGMAGWKTEEMLAGIEGVVNLAAASGEDMATVSSIVVDTLTAMGKTADSTGEFVDVLAQAAMNSNTNVALMGETFKYAAPVAGALGYDFKDLAIATGLMASSGIKGTLAGTALRNMLTRMAKPTKESRDAMDKLGLSLTDEEGKMYSLMDIMTTLRKNFSEGGDAEGMAEALTTLGGLTDDQIDEYKSGLGEMTAAEEAFYAAELGGLRGMSGLLALANSTDDQFLQLADSIYGADGAVGQMASVRLNNLQGDVTILKDAVRDAGIEMYYQFNDELRDLVQLATDFVNSAAKKIPEVFNKIAAAFPTLWRKFKQYAKPVFGAIVAAGSWIIDHGHGIIAIIAGIGTALVTYKILSTITHIVIAIMKLASLGTVAGVIVGVIGALSTLAGLFVDYKLTEQELIDQSLADHFGDIALSMEDISSVADYIVATDNLGKVKEALDAFDDLDQYSSQISEAVKELNKLNWKVSIGMELTPEEQDQYSSTIDSFIRGVQDYVINEYHGATISLATIFDEGNADKETVSQKLDKFFESNITELESLGTKLRDAVTDAFNDGLLEIEEIDVIRNLQQQMADIQMALAVDDYNVALAMLGAEFSGKDLTPDAFLNLQERLGEASAKASEAYRENYARTQAILNAAHESGDPDKRLSDAEYTVASDANAKKMREGIAKTNLQALQFQLNTIFDTYGSEVDAYLEELSKALSNEALGTWFENSSSEFVNALIYQQLEDWLESDERMDDVKRDAIGTFLEGLAGSMSELSAIDWNALPELRDQYSELIKSYDLLSGITGDREGLNASIAHAMADSDNPALNEYISSRYERITGIAYSKAQEAIDKIFSEPFSVNSDLDITLNPRLIGSNGDGTLSTVIDGKTITLNPRDFSSASRITGHANGGFINGLQLSWLGERGPEAVIPLNGSDRAMSLWEKTGQLLGMKSLSDRYNISGGSSGGEVKIEYNPTLQFYGEAPSRADLDDALKMSQDEFEAMMAQYLKNNGRLAFR